MSKCEQQLRRDIVEIGRLMHQKCWIASNDGNISVRLDEERILVTPTGISKGFMTPEDLIVVDRSGVKVEGKAECTSEIAMHLAIYCLRPDVEAVVHAHPPAATGFAVAGRALNLAILPEVVVGLGCVPLADYGLPGTTELTEPLMPYIPKYDAILLANHGVVCSGADLWKAYFRMETVEHVARISLAAELLGGPRLLQRVDVQRLFESRKRYGVSSRTTFEPGFPVVAEDVAQDTDSKPVTRKDLAGIIDELLRQRGVV